MPREAPQHSLMFTRQIAASPVAIYAAWTDREQMARWLGKVDADVRVGGRYRFESPAERAGKTYIYTGEYLALEQDRRVVQSFLAGEPDPTTPNPYPNEFIEIRLENGDNGRTEVTFINGWDGQAIDEESRRVALAAWSEWLDRMEKSLHGVAGPA